MPDKRSWKSRTCWSANFPDIAGLAICILLSMQHALYAEDFAEKPRDRTDAETVAVLDQAISALSEQPASNFRTILKHALTRLPRDCKESIKSAIGSFLERSPAASADFRCGGDFLRYRATKELLSLKDELLGLPRQPVEPQACFAEPFALDAMQPPWTIEIYGRDFDRVEPEMFLITDGGDYQDVTAALTRRTHYHLTLEIGKIGAELLAASQKLSLAWGHIIRYSIPVIQPTTPLCRSWIEEISAGKTITYGPPQLDGSHSSAGRRGKVWAFGMLDHESNVVDATLCMTAGDPKGKAPTFSGCGAEYAYTTDAERVIERIVGEWRGRATYTTHEGRQMAAGGAAVGPVDRWVFTGLEQDSGSAAEPQVTAVLRAFRIVSSETGNCVSAIEYLEAKRGDALGRATVRRLDPQLEQAPRETLRLRPRFAPGQPE